MGKLFFPYMSPREQTAIADRADSVEQRIVALRNELNKLQKEKAGLMHDLLTGKVTVQAEPEEELEAAHV
jgi:type I restriction enzyme S subunit